MRKPTTLAVLWLLRFVLLASVTLLCFCVTVQAQRTTRIPADAPTIQSAIDAAATGDTLLVAPGTYFENLDLRGKAITLRSTEGPTVTILDGRNLAPVVTFATRETAATTLSGFTLRNGSPASPTLRGGGILLRSASPTLTGNILTQNRCTAIDATDASPIVTRNILRETQPGPICITQSPAIFHGGSPTLIHNTVERNDLPNPVTLLDASATLQGNIIRNNSATPSALLISNLTQSALLEQNLIYANTTPCGPAVSLAAPALLRNNTIADNASSPCDTAVELTLAGQQITLANNILAASSLHPALSCASTPPTLRNNLLHNTAGPILANTCPDTGSLLADPLFAARDQSDYHLSPHSPALDAASASPSLPRDLDGTPRPQAGPIDLGVYQHVEPRTLAATTTSLTTTPNPAEAFQPITLLAHVTSGSANPTGSVTFSVNAQPLATIPLDANGQAAYLTTILPAATCTLTAAYSGSDTLAPSSSSVAQSIAPATTLLSFAVTPSSAGQAQAVTLSATVEAPLSTQPPTGQVQFTELTTHQTLATLTLDATGHASTPLPAMATGTWLVDAAYLGSPNFAPVTLPASNALTLTIASQGYVLAAANPTVTIQSGHHAPVTLTLTSLGSFAATLSLSCVNLPANATCTFSPTAPSLTAGATLPVTLTLDTDAIPGFLAMAHPSAAPVLALLLGVGLRRRRRAVASLCFAISLTGCSSQYPAQVPSGSYPIQVISQVAGTSSTQTLSLTLVVTN